MLKCAIVWICAKSVFRHLALEYNNVAYNIGRGRLYIRAKRGLGICLRVRMRVGGVLLRDEILYCDRNIKA